MILVFVFFLYFFLTNAIANQQMNDLLESMTLSKALTLFRAVFVDDSKLKGLNTVPVPELVKKIQFY